MELKVIIHCIIPLNGRSSCHDQSDGDEYTEELGDGTLNLCLNHVAEESLNGNVSDEIDHMFQVGV